MAAVGVAPFHEAGLAMVTLATTCSTLEMRLVPVRLWGPEVTVT